MDKNKALVIDNVTKRYNQEHGIFNISLAVSSGEVFGFLGPNGAGKSTTINTVLDILRPDSGSVSILGLDAHRQSKGAHSRVGYLSGDMETDPTLTGRQYLNFVAHLRGGIDSEKILILTKRLKADLNTKIKHLSRGSKQKIGLIAALMHDPDLLILDEPTSGLDPLIQVEFGNIIREHKEKGKTAFISSHVLSEIQSMCDRVGFIKDGKLVNVSTLGQLMANAPRKVILHFKDKVPEESLKDIQGIENFQLNDGTVNFLFQGDINKLLSLLSRHKLANIVIDETDLEELFMHYYKGESKDV